MTFAELLAAFYAAVEGLEPDEELIALVERFEAGEVTEVDGDQIVVMTWPDGVEPMTDDELETLRVGLEALADQDEASVSLLTGAADMVVGVNAETDARTDLAEAEEADLAAARARLRGETDDATDGDQDDPDAENADDAESGDGDDATADGDDATADANADPEPVLAAATRRSQLAALARRSQAGSRNRVPARAAAATDGNRIVFAAGLDQFGSGSETFELADVSRAMAERLEAFAGSGIPAGREDVRVARVHANFPPERRLVDDRGNFIGVSEASDRIAAVYAAGQAPEALAQVAAGGFCAPAQPIYTVNIMGQSTRPIRDQSLVSFQASRGRVVQLSPPRLQAVLPSIGIWTEANDIAAASDPNIRKTELRVVCGPEVTAQVQGIYASLRYGEMLSRSYGEWVNAWAQLSVVGHAQVAEQQLFTAMQALATPVSAFTTKLSATRDFLNYMGRLAWHIRLRNRELRNFPMRLTTSSSVVDIVAEDIAVSAHGNDNTENLAQAEAILNAGLAARNINVTWSPDILIPGAQGSNTAAANYPPSVPFVLAPEGWAVHLDQGTLDLGVVRDSALIDANDVKTFVETFEGVHRLGAQADARTGSLNLCPSGSVYGFTDPDGKCASYT